MAWVYLANENPPIWKVTENTTGNYVPILVRWDQTDTWLSESLVDLQLPYYYNVGTTTVTVGTCTMVNLVYLA